MKVKKIILLLFAVLYLVSVKGQENNYKSIHQEQQEYYNDIGISAEEYYELNVPAAAIQNKSSKTCNLNKIVFGWHPYWANGLEVNYDWSLLSDLCFFSYEVNPTTGDANNTHGWATSSVVDEAIANGVRVSLCVTLFTDHATFFASSTAKQNLINNLISMLQAKGANGVNIDFESVSSSLEPQFTAFLIELCTQMHTEIPGSIVSVCTPAVDWGNLFNELSINTYIDYYTIMGYDYYYGGSSVAGPSAPLYTFDLSNYNLAKTLNYYQSQGASRQKIILGLPYYGREWNTVSETVPSNTTSSVSSRTYKAIKDNVSGNYSTRQWEQTSFTPYYTYYSSNWRQCFCDDEISLGYRYDLVNMMGIAGIGIWALGNDDGYTELWDLIQDKFTDCATSPCEGTFYDLGGPYKNYYDDSDYTFTIAPTYATQVSLEFPVFDIEAGSGTECNYDYLEIFDGASAASTSLGKFCNTTGNPGTITSSGNALTVKVHTDGATTKSGFKGVWNCIQDNILPETSVTANEWESADFTATFTDNDNEVVDMRFYQVLDNDGTEWRANNDYGFFNDNFQSEIHSDWTNLSGTWSINNGHLMQSDESLSNNNIYANVTQIAGDIYLYHWQMKISGAGTNRRAGLYMFCSDPESSQRGDAYMIYFRVEQNTCEIYKSDGNTITIYTEDYVNVNAEEWYDYKVIFDTNTGEIKAYQNNVLASSWTDPSPHTVGNSISLRTGNCVVEYDDIKVYKNRNSTETITVGIDEEVQHQNFGQTNSACRIKTIITDEVGNFSNINGTDVNIDWTAPEDVASVSDGQGLDIDTTYIGTALSANWVQANEPNSYVTSYEYCIGFTPGAADVVDWTDNGTSTSVTHIGLVLISETEYYFSIRATNIVNLTSTITSSDGVLYIDPEDFTIADFEFENTGVCESSYFSLINYSVNANSYFWTISGPVNFTSTDENPEFLPLDGEYTVKLVAYGNLSNDSVTKTAEITVSPNPIANFSAIETDLELPDATAYFINSSENANLYLWEFGDGETSAQAEPWHTYTSSGLFTVRLEAFSYGCGSNYKTLTDYIHVINPTNIEDFSEINFSLYPNPSSDKIFVRLKQGEITLIKIYDVSGQIIYQKKLQTNFTSIDISSFATGVYIIEISTKDKVMTGQVIID
ncbi:MAG: glycosyl hydrolase family 18 protein [Bacteroidales bacterium]|nr:glycosyl hydrolase family 18 protein [Bacteroidales bacterium]